eukprot:COSAG02_NODE_6356_length_3627_cov_54.021259_5_plen_82_part_00
MVGVVWWVRGLTVALPERVVQPPLPHPAAPPRCPTPPPSPPLPPSLPPSLPPAAAAVPTPEATAVALDGELGREQRDGVRF